MGRCGYLEVVLIGVIAFIFRHLIKRIVWLQGRLVVARKW